MLWIDVIIQNDLAEGLRLIGDNQTSSEDRQNM